MGISPQIQTASIGMADSIILMILALVVFGPRRLPQIGKQIGKLMYEFRKASNDFKWQMEEELRNAEEADRRKREEAERQKSLTDAQKAASEAQAAAEKAVSAAAQAQVVAQAVQSGFLAPEPGEMGTVDAPVADVSPTEVEPPVIPATEETGLRVQPPSTGEQVAAARPGRAATESTSPESPANESTESSMKIEPASEERPATEPTAHHG